MEHDYQALARRHMWLSWKWGMGLSYVLILVCISFLIVSRILAGTQVYLSGIIIYLVIGPFFYLGLPALLGAYARERAMQRVFTTATSRSRLVLQTTWIVVLSIIVPLLAYILVSFVAVGSLFTSSLLGTAQFFFGVSLPWLISSVLAALHLWSGRMPEPLPETAANPTTTQ